MELSSRLQKKRADADAPSTRLNLSIGGVQLDLTVSHPAWRGGGSLSSRDKVNEASCVKATRRAAVLKKIVKDSSQ